MAPKTTRMDRAKMERMYFMGRASAEDSAAAFIVTGQSGKVWTVSIPRKGANAASSSRNNRFRCNCPDNIIRKGTCKHMLFVCLRVLKMSEEHLKGLEGGEELSVSILHELLNDLAPEVDEQYTAPAALKARLKSIAGDFEAGGETAKVEPRLAEEGESCPICYDDLLDGTALVHCGYGCGKPVHTECFERYSKAQQDRYAKSEIEDTKLKCVTCRTDWVIEPVGALGTRGMLRGRRAINLADEMPDQFEITPASGNSTHSRVSSKAKSGSKGASSSKAKVSRGRVTKSKAASSGPRSSPERKSSRLAAQSTSSPRKATNRKAPTRKASSRKASTAKVSTAKVSMTKASKSKFSKGKTAGRKASTSKSQKSKMPQVAKSDTNIVKTDVSKRARAARAARRGSTRMTRSMST